MQWKLAGFHANPTMPFLTGLPRHDALYDFDPTRLRFYPDTSAPIITCYSRYYARNMDTPYVYFKAQRLDYGRYEYGYFIRDANGNPLSFAPYTYQHGPDNVAVPYLEYIPGRPSPINPSNAAEVRNWRNMDTFQIVNPGFGNTFGNSRDGDNNVVWSRYTRSGVGFSADGGDYDNIANFCERRLEDEIE